MTGKYGNIAILCILVIFISSCKSSKTGSVSKGMKQLEEMKYLEEVIGNSPSFDSFSSKMKLTVDLNGKETSVNGSLKMKRNELIQLSIAPVLGIEVARIEISPDSLLVLDRINKRYLYAPLSVLSFLANGDIDFYTIQSLFHNEIFLPGKKSVTPSDLSAFTLQQEEDRTVISLRKPKRFDYRFTTDRQAELTETRISAYTGKYQLNWNYGDFRQLDRKNFPARMEIAAGETGKLMHARLDLSRMQSGKINLSRTSVSRKYKQIGTDELLKLLFK